VAAGAHQLQILGFLLLNVKLALVHG
jgi:hypothetical protein